MMLMVENMMRQVSLCGVVFARVKPLALRCVAGATNGTVRHQREVNNHPGERNFACLRPCIWATAVPH